MILSLLLVMVFCTNVMAKETTLSGKIMADGTFMADGGESFMISGDNLQELKQSIGKLIEVKGTVKEQEGKNTITIIEYKLLEAPAAKSVAPLSEKAEEKAALPKE